MENEDGEWAIDHILSHRGSATDAVFEILWKSGDRTWMPYHQISDIPALTDYLDLVGAARITDL
ncbi:hypothetical protein CERSUDRAFT_139039, partial [Gelatoporia subvermispora B]